VLYVCLCVFLQYTAYLIIANIDAVVCRICQLFLLAAQILLPLHTSNTHYTLHTHYLIYTTQQLVGGLPVRDTHHAQQIADFALLVSTAVQAVKSPVDGTPINIRIGGYMHVL